MIKRLRKIPKIWLYLALWMVILYFGITLTEEVIEALGGEQEEIHVIDHYVLNFFYEMRSHTLTLWAMNLTALGSVPVLTSLCAFMFLLFWVRGDRMSAWHIALASIGGAVITRSLKAWMQRPRPDLIERLVEETSFSYPSGHALASTAIYFTLSLLFARLLKTRNEKTFVYVAAFILINIIGLSRVYLAVHYPSDVAGGTAFGFAWALLVAFLFTWLERRTKSRTAVSV